MQMLGDQGFSLAMVQHLFFSFHVRMMMAITRREDRLQIEQEGGFGRKGGRGGGRKGGLKRPTSMRSLIGNVASHDISAIHREL